MRRLTAIFVPCLLTAVFGGQAMADPFGFADLFFGRDVLKTVKDRRAEVGLHFSIAPVKAVLQHEVASYRKKVQDRCPDCNALIDTALERGVTSNDIRQADSVAALQQLIDRKASEAGQPLTPEQQQAVDDAAVYLDQHPDQRDQLLGQNGMLADVVEAYANRDGVAFGIEPYGVLNLKYLQLGIVVPLAGFFKDSISDFAMGNVGLDVRFGHHWGDKISFGLTGGLGVGLPSGMEKADTLGLSNMLFAPRYLHEYLTLSPYLTVGLDMRYVAILAHLELFNMMGVRGGHDYMGSLHYGFDVMLTLFNLFGLNVELDGLQSLSNADVFNSLYLTAGVRFKFWIIKPSAAVQIPLVTQGDKAFSTVGGVAVGSPAKFNVLVNLGFEF